MDREGSHLWRAISEHATAWVVGGVLLAATGFAPEEWLARTVNGLHIPESVLHLWAAGVDVRAVPIALGVALIAGNMLWRQWPPIAAALPAVLPEPAAPPPPNKPSIAVLPFANLSGDPEQDYFSDGVADDIISELSRDHSLFVIARNSSFTYKGHPVDVKQVASDLGVRYVLEGSVRSEATRVRLNAQLIDAETGNHLWAERYDRDLAGVFAVQAEIAAAVTFAITPTVADAERHRALRMKPGNLDAWGAYQRGLWHHSQHTPNDHALSEKFFRQAIELDPTFAGGYVGLAQVFDRAAIEFHTRSFAEGQGMAEAYARQAVALDDGDAEAHSCLADTLVMRGDHRGAREEAERALAISPNSASVYGSLGIALLYSGQPKEGLVALEECLRRDPRSPVRSPRLNQIIVANYFCRDYEAALEAAHRAIRSFPNNKSDYRWLAATLGQLGRTAEAKVVLEKISALGPTDFNINVRQRMPWLRPEDHQHLVEGLRKAGWND